MAKKRTLVLLRGGDAPSSGGLAPLGTLDELRGAMRAFNIAPDGSGPVGMGERVGTGVLHGPGMVIEVMIHPDQRDPEVTQALIAVTDEDFAWPVLARMCRALGWKLMDPESGRSFLG